MGNETSTIENNHSEGETYLHTQLKNRKKTQVSLEENSGIQLGVRVLTVNALSACEKIDRMFGSGGEAIIHYMWFESGQNLFENIIRNNPDKNPEELLTALIDFQCSGGWGEVSMRIIRTNPPTVKMTAMNSPIKSVQGSQKQMIGAFWAGVFSNYFNRQLTSRDFRYDVDKDEFSCTITI
jgi:hypothetical protein